MKRSVSSGVKIKLSMTAGVLLWIALTDPGMAMLLVLFGAVMVLVVKVDEHPPRWLLRSPVGRWLRRH